MLRVTRSLLSETVLQHYHHIVSTFGQSWFYYTLSGRMSSDSENSHVHKYISVIKLIFPGDAVGWFTFNNNYAFKLQSSVEFPLRIIKDKSILSIYDMVSLPSRIYTAPDFYLFCLTSSPYNLLMALVVFARFCCLWSCCRM